MQQQHTSTSGYLEEDEERVWPIKRKSNHSSNCVIHVGHGKVTEIAFHMRADLRLSTQYKVQ